MHMAAAVAASQAQAFASAQAHMQVGAAAVMQMQYLSRQVDLAMRAADELQTENAELRAALGQNEPKLPTSDLPTSMALRLAAASPIDAGMDEAMMTKKSTVRPSSAHSSSGVWESPSVGTAPKDTLSTANLQKKSHETLRNYLQELRGQDQRCVFITRRINKLGFRSKDLLEQHYSRYGEVTQVFVAHSKVKPFRDATTVPRTRPGNFGLVVMKRPADVERILAEGSEQTVAGMQIEVRPFERTETQIESQEDDSSNAVAALPRRPPPGLTEPLEFQEPPSPKVTEYDPDAFEPAISLCASGRQASSESNQSGQQDWNSSGGNSADHSTSSSNGARAYAGNTGIGHYTDYMDIGHYMEAPGYPSPTDGYVPHGFLLASLPSPALAATMPSPALPPPMGFPLGSIPGAAGIPPSALGALALPTTAPFGLPWPATSPHLAAATAPCVVPTASCGVEKASNARVALAAAAAAAMAAAAAAVAVTDDTCTTADLCTKKEESLEQPGKQVEIAIQEEGQSQSMHKDTLRSHLTEVSMEDPACIFIARRINKLGFRSREVLRQHYAQYGEVSRVLVAHSKVKPFRDAYGQLRTRPGGLGLIVMKTVADVLTILAVGEEHIVAGHQIRVQAFERPKAENMCNPPTQSSNTDSTTASASREGSGSSGNQSSSSRDSSTEPDEKEIIERK
jgi:hypothetical protein